MAEFSHFAVREETREMSELLDSGRDAIWPFDMPTPSQRSLQINGGYRLEDSDASVCGQVWSTVLGESILCAAKCQRVDTVEGMVTGDHLKTANSYVRRPRM